MRYNTEFDKVLQRASKSGYICPKCNNGSGHSGTGAEIDKDGKHLKCFSCDFYGDIFEVIGQLNNLNCNDPNQFILINQIAKEEYNITDDTIKDSAEKSQQQNDVSDELIYKKALEGATTNYQYLLSRGIKKETQQRIGGIYFKSNWLNPKGNYNCGDRCLIDTGNNSIIARATSPDVDKKYKVIKVNKTQIYNNRALKKSNEIVFIVEGEIDCLSIETLKDIPTQKWQMLKFSAIGLGGASNTNKLKDLINPTQRYIILPDNDKTGIETGKKIEKILSDSGALYINALDRVSYTEGCKDANDELMCGDLQSMVLTSIEEVKKLQSITEKSCAAAELDYFRTIKDKPRELCVPTGFNNLNNVLNGGFYEGLYIIGAISSLGKSTFMLQVADQIAQSGQDVLFIALEMSKKEMIAKSLSRCTYELNPRPYNGVYKAQTTRKILDSEAHKHYTDEEEQLYQKAVNRYSEYANHVYIYEGRYKNQRLGVSHVREIVKNHILETGNKPVVMVDYLQILAPSDVKASDKQNTDISVFELKEISRDYKIPVFAISSFNRENYRNEVSMTSFKESGKHCATLYSNVKLNIG